MESLQFWYFGIKMWRDSSSSFVTDPFASIQGIVFQRIFFHDKIYQMHHLYSRFFWCFTEHRLCIILAWAFSGSLCPCPHPLFIWINTEVSLKDSSWYVQACQGLNKNLKMKTELHPLPHPTPPGFLWDKFHYLPLVSFVCKSSQ